MVRQWMLFALLVGCVEDPLDESSVASEASLCPAYGQGVYQPFATAGHYSSGSVAQLPWLDGNLEDFGGYGTALPLTVECANDKARRSHLDVTAGCLVAVHTGGGAYTRGQIRAADGAFRAVALGVATDPARPTKWTDQSVEYRFFYTARVGDTGNPGFKAFARYRTEEDLYVASWRTDGVVQIQRKQCGQYITLAILPSFGPPSPNTWHWLRFDAVGDHLSLYLDQRLVLQTTSSTFSWGTAGMRIDSMDGAYIDNWRMR